MVNSTRYLIASLIAVIGATGLALQLRSGETLADRSYVGQETCMSSGCHSDAYSPTSDYQGAEAFRETMHQRIHLRPTPETVVFDKYFEGDSVLKYYVSAAAIPGQDTILIYLSKSADKKDYFVQMRISGQTDSTEKMKVAYTYGGNGWIQRLLIEVGGSLHVVPFQFVLPGYRQRRAEGGTFHFLDYKYWAVVDFSILKFLNLNSNAFRAQSWDKNCAFCHTNGFDVARRVNGSDTSWKAVWVGVDESDSAVIDQNIKIGCESCHGPGSEHVARPTKDNIVATSTWPMTREGTDLKLALCDQCHTRARSTNSTHRYLYDERNRRPYVPGQLLDSFVAHMWNGMDVWPDRITSYTHHQTGQDYKRSAQYKAHLYKNGCWDCHTVHHDKQGLPYQMNKNWYSLQDGEGCMSCHGSTGPQQSPPQANLLETTTYNGRAVNKHSKHTAEISQCVNCHFTKSVSIGFIDLPTKPLYEFTDHTFRVLGPTVTRTYKDGGIGIGMINTCSESCHRNGRGTRNFEQSKPEAPAYGTVDFKVGTWNEKSDLDLADSLWFHYQRMYPEYLSATPVAGAVPIALYVTSVVPNPFRNSTTVKFTVARASSIELDILDMKGNRLRNLAAGHHTPGTYSAVWDGNGELGEPLESGSYLVRVRASGATASRIVSLVR